MLVTFEISHLDILGIDFNEEQSQIIDFIFVTFEVFQLDISGNDFNEKQL